METVSNQKIVYYMSTEIFVTGLIVTFKTNLVFQACVLSLLTFFSFLVLSDFIISAKNQGGAEIRTLGNEWK